MNGAPERGFVPPVFPAVERIRGDGVVETVHSFPFGRQRPARLPLRVSAPVAWVKLPVMIPISKSTVTSASMGVGDVRRELGNLQNARRDRFARGTDLGLEWRRIGRLKQSSVGELDPDIGAVFGERHRERLGARRRDPGAQRQEQDKPIVPAARIILRLIAASPIDTVSLEVISLPSAVLACVGAATRWSTSAPWPDPATPYHSEATVKRLQEGRILSICRDPVGWGLRFKRAEGEPLRGQAKKRRRLSPEAIIEAAIRLADAEGLEAVSIRRVAAELDGRAMSLYDHFASKRELLAAMTDEVVGEMLVSQPLPEDWREAVAVSARTMYAAYASHPWAIFAPAERVGPGPNGDQNRQADGAGAGDPSARARGCLAGAGNRQRLRHRLLVSNRRRP